MNEQISKTKKYELARLKNNKDIFNSLLGAQKKISHSPEGLGIALGNIHAANTLIKVCNPYCGPCAKAHPEIDSLLQHQKNLKVQIIFMATNGEKDKRAKPAKHLLAIASNNDEEKTMEALGDWYLLTDNEYEAFAKKYVVNNNELDSQKEQIDAMDKWTKKNEIQVTPTYFFNGWQLPDIYNIKDLKYFLAQQA